MSDALQGADQDSFELEEYRLLAQMVVSNQQFWPKPPKDSVKEQLDLAEKEVLLAAENLALKQASSRNAVQDGSDRVYNDKIFSVCQDESHRVNKCADNPFQTYDAADVEPLMINPSEDDDEPHNSATLKDVS